MGIDPVVKKPSTMTVSTHVYPSGFIGLHVDELEGEEAPSSLQRIELTRQTVQIDIVNSEGKPAHDEEVDILFKKYHRYGVGAKDFDLREAILKKAIEHFSLNRSIDRWVDFVHIQLSHAPLSYNHVDVLKEILNYVTNGGNEFALSVWERILSNKANVRIMNKDEKNKVIEHYLSNLDKQMRIDDLIVGWVSQEHGIGHLLRTLKLMYGDIVECGCEGE